MAMDPDSLVPGNEAVGPPPLPELPPPTESQRMAEAISTYLQKVQKWATDYSTSMRAIETANAADILAIQRQIDDLQKNQAESDGPLSMRMRHSLSPSIPATSMPRLTGADGVLVHHLPDRDILFGDSDPVAEDVLMIGGGGGGGGGETVVTGDEVWISVTGENYISHIGPGPEAYTTICELAGEPCCLYAVSVGIAWDADGHVIKGGYANASGLPDVTWVETGT